MENLQFFKGREISFENTRVFVYFNLHKKVFSVKALEGPHKGKVVLHIPALTLRAALFTVQEKARQRVLEERQKNIHAGVAGYIISIGHDEKTKKNLTEVYYNPYETKHFVVKNDMETPVHYSALVHLEDKKVYCK